MIAEAETPATEATTLAESLAAWESRYENYRFEAVRNHLGKTEKKPKAEPGPLPFPCREAIEDIADVLTDPDNLEPYHHQPAAQLLDAWRAEFEEEIPGRTLAALWALKAAIPKEWSPLEFVQDLVDIHRGMPGDIEQLAKVLGVDAHTAQRLMSGELRKLPKGHKRPEIAHREKVVADWRAEYDAARERWCEFARQRQAARTAEVERQCAIDNAPCPESFDELFSLPGMSDSQISKMKKCTLEEVGRQREIFEREKFIGAADHAAKEAKRLAAAARELELEEAQA